MNIVYSLFQIRKLIFIFKKGKVTFPSRASPKADLNPLLIPTSVLFPACNTVSVLKELLPDGGRHICAYKCIENAQ